MKVWVLQYYEKAPMVFASKSGATAELNRRIDEEWESAKDFAVKFPQYGPAPSRERIELRDGWVEELEVLP